MNCSVGFIQSSAPGSNSRQLRFRTCQHASPSQIRLHSARKTTITTSRFRGLQCRVNVHARAGHAPIHQPATSHGPNSGFLLRLSDITNFPVIAREWVDTQFTEKLASSLLCSLFSTLPNTTTITGNVSSIMIALEISKLCLINARDSHAKASPF